MRRCGATTFSSQRCLRMHCCQLAAQTVLPSAAADAVWKSREFEDPCGSPCASAPQVDIFSFGVILMEVFAKSVTGAALLTVGDMEECEMYAWKVRPYSFTLPNSKSISQTTSTTCRSSALPAAGSVQPRKCRLVWLLGTCGQLRLGAHALSSE